MNDLNHSRNLAAPPRADVLLAGRGVASARSRILLLLAGLLAMATPLRAENQPAYVFAIDSSAVPGGIEPTFLALDSSNNVYVTDYYNSRVIKLTAGGSYLTQWGGNGTNNGRFVFPQGVAVDSSNNIYVADLDNNRIEKFDSNGNYVTQWGSGGSGNGQFFGPQGIAVDSRNNVYVADAYNHRIEKFTSNGSYLTQWGGIGSGYGQLEYGVAVDSSNNVYLTDHNNNRVEKFNDNGNYLTQWGSYGGGHGQFNGPGGVAVDSSNNVYVADTDNARIEKFDSSGNYLTQWSSGSGPQGVAVDRSGKFIYVAGGGSQIEVFAYNTNIGPAFITSQPAGQTVPADNNVTFSVGTIGAAPFSYQWNSNNVAVPGATNASFTLTNVSLVASGSTYSVLVGNTLGSELSSNAVLTVWPAADFRAPTYLFQFGSPPGSYSPLSPTALAMDQSNNLYVADPENHRIEKFDRNGNYLTQWGSPGTNNGQFVNPRGVAVDSSNNVYVVDENNDRVEKFDREGNYLAQWGSQGSGNGQFGQPEGIAVDQSNNLYVADPDNSRIEKFDRSGNYLTQWGAYGSGNGQFSFPVRVAVDHSNNVYVADTDNARIEKFDSNGNYLTQWGGSGSGNGQFEYPEGIAVDNGNNVYVVDFDNNRVEKFDSSGNYLAQWGSAGSGNGQFYNPEDVAVDSSGNSIYVTDPNNARIQIFVNNTNIVPPFITSQPATQAVAAGMNATLSVIVIGSAPFAYQWTSNDVVVPGATNASFTLTNVSLSGTGSTYSVLVTNDFGSELSSQALLTVLPAANFITPTYLFEFAASAVFLALDSSNNVYVTDINNGIEKFSSSGTYLTQWGIGGPSSQFSEAAGIAVDSSNNVYVVDFYNQRVEKFDGNGNYLTQWGSYGTNNGQFDYPRGIAVDSSNQVYVADAGNHRIEKFTSNGNYLTQWGNQGNGSGQFNAPAGVAVDSSNYVYVVDSGNARVQKFTSNGNYLTQWGSYGSGKGQFNGPEGVAVDASNNVYVADENNYRVEKFDGNGNYLTQWGSYGSGIGQFEYLTGMAVDRTGNDIYVADYDNARIQVFVNDTSIVPPIITQQPASQTVAPGTNVTFSVGLFFATPFAYQWTSNNVAVPGATNATFTLINVNLSDSGNFYSVLVANDFGSEWSSNAELTVLPAADFIAPAYLFQMDSAALPGGFAYLPSVALDSSNNIYLADFNNGIVELTAGGSYLAQWGSYGSGNGQFEFPEGLALDGSNDIYVADTDNNRIEKFSNGGAYQTQWGSAGRGSGQFEYPQGVAVDSSNNVYVADTDNDRIEKFDSNGTYLTQWGGAGSGHGQFELPEGIAVDSRNNIYVADTDNSRIEKFDSSGTYLTQWGSYGTNNGQFANPEGIAVDSSDNVYVTDTGNHRIEKCTSTGAYLTQWGGPGRGNGQLENPHGVAVDSSGNTIYVADYDNYRVQVFVNNANIVPPVFAQQPANQTVPAGFNVTFSVGVAGTAPFSYQWNSNNVAVAGATNATFTLTNVRLSDSGATCSVQVSNGYGNASSGNAVLTVLPALVTTQPASGRSATGAMLNGTAVTGPDETVVWFDWGTDTNYGNITGATVVSGNSGSNTISAPLSGLPGNFYHYRMDAANDFGVAYGDDQFFTVGFAPSVTTLPPTNGANGATLEAAVNPEGWDTTVYFHWGTTTLTNTTPGMGIGAGATVINVSSFVPGLLASTPYQYQVVASNALGAAVGNIVFGDPNHQHYFISGSKINITLSAGIYIITAYGAAGGYGYSYNGTYGDVPGGLGVEMSAEFNFSTATNLTLLVGGRGHANDYGGGGGGGGSFVVQGGTPLVVAGGGGGGGDYFGYVGNGNVSTNGSGGGGYYSTPGEYVSDATGGAGGTAGGGGGTGGDHTGGFFGGPGYSGGGGGGGGLLGDGSSGSSFERGGYGGRGGYGRGGYGGGGAGGADAGGAGGEGAPGGGGGYSGGGGGGDYDLWGSLAGGGYYTIYESGYGGGGGSIIDSSAITNFAEVSGIASPDDPYNGEIIITAVPTSLGILTTDAAFGYTNGVFGFDISGPSGASVVIQASTDLYTWIPLQTNLLGGGPFFFSDSPSNTNVQRFYRAQLSP